MPTVTKIVGQKSGVKYPVKRMTLKEFEAYKAYYLRVAFLVGE